ncbi:MAG: hypothetical protein ACLPV8_25475 [Steroidobacteraceae bacterium]
MAGYTSVDPCHGTRLSVATAVQCKAGVLGGVAGIPYDTVLFGVYLQLNATAVSVTIAGLNDQAGVAQNLLISGETTTDYFWMPPAPILNSFAAFVFTASIANLVWIFTRPYYGPESPTAGGYVINP